MTTLILERPARLRRFVLTKKVGYDTSSRQGVSDLAVRMNSDLAKTTETVGFRFPALVSLAPKRRSKASLVANQVEAVHITPKKPRLKRSGRVILRCPAPVSSFASPVPAAVNCAPYTP
jgi:hypothetical protein